MPAPSYTYTITNGQTADATQVMQNFNDILNGVSDGTKDLSISALTCAGTATLNGAVTLGNATGDDITITGRVASDFDPKTAATYNLGDSTQTWLALYLDNGVTDGGAVYFNASSTAFIKSDASASDLDIDGFTNLDINALNLKGTGDIAPETGAAEDIGTTTLPYRALYLDNGATDGGALYFNAGSASYLKSTSDGTELDLDGFTTLDLNSADLSQVSKLGIGAAVDASYLLYVSSSSTALAKFITSNDGGQELQLMQDATNNFLGFKTNTSAGYHTGFVDNSGNPTLNPDASGVVKLGTWTQRDSAKFTVETTLDTLQSWYTSNGGGNSLNMTHGTNQMGIYTNVGAAYRVGFFTGAGAGLLTFDQSGNVRIGSPLSTDPLATDADGDIVAGTSDERLKENFSPYKKGLAEINQLKTYTYQWKKESKMRGSIKTQGFKAQELELVFPECVGRRDQLGIEDCRTFSEQSLVPAMVNAMQEMSEKISKLEETILLLKPNKKTYTNKSA